ncbi:MAG: peptidoglycan DD-metalloendopeptidase family protein [Clostridia bacterium]|nr:peptidoglycan DD-metalloendopeptidase family protein [Clostridia bacterium]
MPQGNHPTEDKGTSENRIKLEQAIHDDAVKKAYHDVQKLKEQIEQLKAQAQKVYGTPATPAKQAEREGAASDATAIDNEAARAAEEVVRKEAEKKEPEVSEILSRTREESRAIIEDAIRKEKEAKERLEQKRAEAAEKRKALLEAEKRAARMKRNLHKAEIQSELNRTMHAQEEKWAQLRKKREQERQQKIAAAMERQRAETQRKEEARLEREQERLVRAEAAARRREEAQRLREEEQKTRKEIDRLQAEQRENLRKQKEERAEIKRQRRLARKSAELGGGIVNVHGTTVKTEIKPVSSFSLKEFLGFAKRAEINAAETEEEKQKLLEENERIKAEARVTAAHLSEIRKKRRQNSRPYKKMMSAFAFCDRQKKPLLIALSLILVFVVGAAGIVNYFMAYEYSYGDKKLGYVKNKDDVLQITAMVQDALTEEKDMTVALDARDDISFKRVFTGNKDVVIDSQDGVLQRLSYLGDINVKAVGMYIDGRKAGAVKDKDTAAGVLQNIQDKYANHDEGTVIDEAVIVENVEFRESNTPMNDVLSQEALVKKLCTETEKETVHTVENGETLDSIAENHSTTKEQIIADNNLTDEQLKVGSTIVIKEIAPLLTVRITETRSHEEKTAYKTIKKADDEMYEGVTEVSREGKKGKSLLVDKTVSINGEVVDIQNLKSEVEKEPVDKVVLVGTKERPPTTGTGTFIWPAYDGTFTVTSEFKWRWGRHHDGIDMGCRTGNDVLAADGGTVIHAGWQGGYGKLVIIDHENGIQTYYAHNSALLVNRGDKVFQGQHIAEAGNTGHSYGSHIHFGVKDNGSFRNPRNYLPAR